MNKIRIYPAVLSALVILCGCAKEEIDIPGLEKWGTGSIDYCAQSFNAEIISPDQTRTYIASGKNICWYKDDRVSVFNSSTENLQYTFAGESGSRAGTLHKIVSEEGDGTSLDRNYAFYPYYAGNSISSEGVLTVTIPDTQTYSKNSFGPGANIMASATTGDDDYDFLFKNAGGYLVVKLYGDATVKELVLTSTAGEKLSGKADIAFDDNGTPLLTMRDDASSSITLDCGDGVKLNTSPTKATEFWFVLPPVTFSQGFSLKIICGNGKFTKQKNTSGTIHRNGIVTVSPFKVSTSAGQYVGLLTEQETWDIDMILAFAATYSDKAADYAGILKLILGLPGSIIETGDIVLSRIIYTTTDPYGNIVEASGLVAYPKSIPNNSLLDWSSTYDKIVSVQHGTCGIDESPSSAAVPNEIVPILKKGNDVVVLADYLGYGISRTGDLQHPYIHNKLTGSTCADLIEAAQEFVANEGLTRSKNYKIELIGYSQGGAATISTLLELEKRTNLSGHIGNVYAGGGPYDLNVFMSKFIADKKFNRASYLAYLIRGIVYGDRLDVDFHNLFAKEVFQGTNPAFNMFSTNPNVASWNSVLGTDLTKVLNGDFFVSGYNGNEDIIKFVNALKVNSCTSYKPKSRDRIWLYHSPNDETVLPQCTAIAASAENWNLPADHIVYLDKDDHSDAGIEFFIRYISENIWNMVEDLI